MGNSGMIALDQRPGIALGIFLIGINVGLIKAAGFENVDRFRHLAAPSQV
jgi:hypothetical protein